jgi:hypothetical protein
MHLPSFVAYFSRSEGSAEWDAQWILMLARVAKVRGAKMDWRPYVSPLFGHILRMLGTFVTPVDGSSILSSLSAPDLAVSGTSLPKPAGRSGASTLQRIERFEEVAKLVVYGLRSGEPSYKSSTAESATSGMLAHLQRLLHTCQSFYHPSNGGAWSSRLAALLQYAPAMTFVSYFLDLSLVVC